MIPSRLFLYLCLSFIFGIFLSSFFICALEKVWEIFVLLFFLTTFCFLLKKKKFGLIFLFLLLIILGIYRVQLAELKISQNILKNYNNSGREIILIGTVSNEPDIRRDWTRLEFLVQELIVGNEKTTISGKVLVTTDRWPRYEYGDKLKIKGQLQAPQNIESFNWEGYLAKEEIYSLVYWPQIELIEKHTLNTFSSKIYRGVLCFKSKLRQSIYQSFLPPQSLIAGAVILGDKKRIPYELGEKLNITGVRHITAISGMHISILSVVLMQSLISIGLWRSQAFYLTILFLVLFIVMIGIPASAFRAGIMAVFLLFSEKIGRKNYASRAVIFAATFILLRNPLLLRFDVGFQLSFLAVIGIIYLSPFLEKWLKIVPREKFLNLRTILAMTLSAQIFTLPILIYNFGTISLLAPITNILILPFIPFIIGWGFLFALTGTIFPFLGWFLSLPCWLILTYVVKIVNWFSQLPFSSINFKDVSWVWLVICYLFLFLILVVYRQRTKKLFLKD